MARKHFRPRKNYSPTFHPVYDEYREIAHYWILQILVQFGAHKKIMNEVLCHEDEVLDELGLTRFTGPGDFDVKALRKELAEMYKQVEGYRPKMPDQTKLAKNIKLLGETIGLSQTEISLLHFRVIASRHLNLRTCLEHLGKGDLLHMVRLLSVLLGNDHSALEHALSHKGKLISSGLISVSLGLEDIMCKIPISHGLADNLFASHRDLFSLFQDNFIKSSLPKLTDADYPHLQADTSLLANYLQECISQKREGVNILIYGSPGSGKTEFVKMLAKRIGSTLYEIATTAMNGVPARKNERFRSYRMSQHILSNSKGNPLVLFDEVEDVFQPGDDGEDKHFGNRSGMKGWINKLLEENPVPAFWLSNNLQFLDKAFIRRFDYVIEIKTPPRSVRSRILDHYLEGIPVSQSWKTTMAEHEHLNPGVVERVAKVVEIAQQNQSEIQVEQLLERALGNTLEAMGLSRSSKNIVQCATDYRLDILNTDCNIIDVCDGLKEYGEGRLCLYGPPGTGKSAFGRYLAETLDRPLMVRRASDILSPWLGMTEKNMAKMFGEAESEKAVLLLDEADTFLRDRSGATRNWEVSEVNEMLTQMESFKGIFIASTNLMDSLDAAALRRFDMKVKFEYLKPEQSWMVFQDTAKRLGLPTSPEDLLLLDEINLLTPGDFANVVRQSRLRKIASAHDLVERLEAECAIKPESGKRKIGF